MTADEIREILNDAGADLGPAPADLGLHKNEARER